MSKLEILAPAGGPEQLRAAVFAGADAVYLAGESFGARGNARNFSREELAWAVRFCHERGVRVHAAVNTLLKDRELPSALEWVAFLCSLPVDAILVQDMGLFSLLRQAEGFTPELHASTQMSLHSPAGAALLGELGAARVVLARELSLEEIRAISDSTPVALESFVHGALCMSVSGQCLLSAMLGGRSGNRGLCAQPCRLPFAASGGGTGHDLSLKDLSFIARLQELEQAGVCSAKIEGRMKRPEYVASAVSACRKAADGEEIPAELLGDLEAVFSRSGFTTGYLDDKRGRGMFGTRTKEDVTGATEKVFSRLHGLYRGERQSIPVDFILSREGDALRLTVWEDSGLSAHGSLPPGEGPLLPSERAQTQLRKTGGTPFLARSVTLPREGVPMAVSQLNLLRRQVLGELLSLRGNRETGQPVFPALPQDAPYRRRESDPLPLRAYFRTAGQVPDNAKSCQAIALPMETPDEALAELRQRGFERIFLELPRARFRSEEPERERIAALLAEGVEDFVAGDLGGLALLREFPGARIHGAFGLNITNTQSLAAFGELGLEDAELSYELSRGEIQRLGGSLPRGLLLYGRQALMLTRNCPLANGPKGCLHCKEPGFLRDRKGIDFPVLCRGREKTAELFNSVPLWLADEMGESPAIDFGLLRFTVENSVESGEILQAVFRQESPPSACTRGLFHHGVE